MILVTGATGLQGGAVAAALIAAGVPVRALVRNPAAPRAIALAVKGVELAKGDFEDPRSLVAAMKGVTGVFSVQLPPTNARDPTSEVRTGGFLIDAAKVGGIDCFVHTSVARAGDQEDFVGWKEGRWWNAYWDSKSAVNDLIWKAAFPYATILKPSYMMNNFSTPTMVAMTYPTLKCGLLETQLNADTRLDMISAEDVGQFAAAAFANPARFNGLSIDLAAEALTMGEVAATIQDVKGVPVEVIFISAAASLAAGINPSIVKSYEWDIVEGYKVDIQALSTFGIPLTSFKQWASRHCGEIIVYGCPV